jgi:gliding motility-associated lipoprotein GldH
MIFKLKGAIVVLVCGLFTACSQREVFLSYHSFPGEGWSDRETARFEAPIGDASTPYCVWIELRHNNLYPFRNLWLFIDYETPSGSVGRDTLSTELADPYGKWYGRGRGIYSYSIPYQLYQQYPDTGVYVYTIRHGMRTPLLEGITNVGLRISASQGLDSIGVF